MVSVEPGCHELDRLRAWCRQLRFDLIYDPLVPYAKGSAYDALEPALREAGGTLDVLVLGTPIVPVFIFANEATAIQETNPEFVNRIGRQYQIERDVDILQALALAGGLTPYALQKKIKILRKQGNKRIVLNFDYESVKQGRNLKQNITLKDGDVVVVP